jgi:perosamine synthetase
MRRIAQMEPWLGEEERRAVDAYMASGGWLTEFTQTRAFEEMIAEYVGSSHVIATSNGTVSLILALLTCDIGAGQEVLVPDYTQIASANTVRLAGATPVLVDIEPRSLGMDLERAEAALTPRTRAMMYVAINGRPGATDRAVEFCRDHGLLLIEDAAQTLGSRLRGRHLGTWGAVGNMSFSPPKVITTGQGGALFFNDEALYRRAVMIKDFGRPKAGVDYHEVLGFNFKFTDIQAVIGIEQMKKLPWRVGRKKAMYRRYRQMLAGIDAIEWLPTNLDDTSPWFVDILVPADRRDALAASLRAQGVGTRPFYPAIHTQPPYAGVRGEFPASADISARGLWLPSSTFLTDDEIDYVCDHVQQFFAG